MSGQGVSAIETLIAWYQAQCDGAWEHQNSIRIETLDNPGWHLEVDLANTQLAGKVLPHKMIERSEDDWVVREVKDDVFSAGGGPANLLEMLELFAAFLEGRL